MIKSLSLYNYKNYTGETVDFSPGLNFLVGPNGMGKTNLLDAIYYLCMAKSHGTPLDRDTVQFDQPFFRLEARVKINRQTHSVCVKVKPGEIKDISIDGKSIDRLSAFIGFLPVIMLSPEDIVLIQGGSVTRRRFMDVALCQAGREYLENLQRYNKLLAQRNALLRSDGYRADRKLLMTYSSAMQEPAKVIYECRVSMITELIPDVSKYYHILSDAREIPALQYISHLRDQNMVDLATVSVEADLQFGRTTKGVHRDDLELLLDGHQVKRFGSQGQIKSLLIALHLAQAEYLKRTTDTMPILLLDDIFDRLDEGRAQSLISLLTSKAMGQVCISDASPARVSRLMTHADGHANMLFVSNGSIRSKPDETAGRENGNLWPHDDSEE